MSVYEEFAPWIDWQKGLTVFTVSAIFLFYTSAGYPDFQGGHLLTGSWSQHADKHSVESSLVKKSNNT